MGGFIVLEDGRACAASNWATDTLLRAIACSVDDEPLQSWLLAQQSEHIGMGMTRVDLRELAPQLRPVLAFAVRDAYDRVLAAKSFEHLTTEDKYGAGWFTLFGELVQMLDRSERGEPLEDFNPHMRGLLPPSGNRAGPGWG